MAYLEGKSWKTWRGKKEYDIYYSFTYVDLDSVTGLIGVWHENQKVDSKALQKNLIFGTGILKESGIKMFLQSFQSIGSPVADAGGYPILFCYTQRPLVHQLQTFLELRALLTSQMHFTLHGADHKDNLEAGLTCVGPGIYSAQRVTHATTLRQALH